MQYKNLLVSFCEDWADEFSMKGFRLYTQEDWDVIKTDLPKVDCDIDSCFGTNESFEFDDGEALLNCFYIKEIDEATSKILMSQFDGEFGEQCLFEAAEYECAQLEDH